MKIKANKNAISNQNGVLILQRMCMWCTSDGNYIANSLQFKYISIE